MHEYKITPIFKGGHICVHLRFLKTKNATLVKMAHQKTYRITNRFRHLYL